MEYLAVAVAAFLLGVLLLPAYRKVRQARQQADAPETYDTRIDDITDIGRERFLLHRAMHTPEVRERIEDTELYDRAAPILGWDD